MLLLLLLLLLLFMVIFDQAGIYYSLHSWFVTVCWATEQWYFSFEIHFSFSFI